MAREIKADTQELLNDTSAIKEDTAQILAEIARLQEQWPGDAQRNHESAFMLERYLENLTSYAETVYDTLSDNVDDRRGSENGSIKRQRSTSPTTRPSSIAGEPRITENNHAAQPIAPRPPEDREEKFEAPEEHSILEQKAADLARVPNAQRVPRRFSKRRRRQHAKEHDDVDQSRFLGPPEIGAEAESCPKPNNDNARRTVYIEHVPPRAETQHAEQSKAEAALNTTNSSGIKDPRETMREGGAARKASRDYTGRSRSVSDMSADFIFDGHYLLPLHSHSSPTAVTQNFTLTGLPVPLKVDRQKRQASKAAVARTQTIAAQISEANSLHSDPQKQVNGVSQTESVYRRESREPVGVGNLSPGTTQNQTEGNAPPQLRSATLKAKSHEHAPRESIQARRAWRQALQLLNDSTEGSIDGSVDSYDSRSPAESATDIKPASLESLFSVSTSAIPVHAICADIVRVLNQLKVKFTEVRGGFRCAADVPAAELGGILILEFDVFVVKIPLLSLHGIQFKRLLGRLGNIKIWQIRFSGNYGFELLS